jgi:hypothetical protein
VLTANSLTTPPQDGICNPVLTFIPNLNKEMNMWTGLQTQSSAGVKDHDSKKEFWNEAIAFSAKDNLLQDGICNPVLTFSSKINKTKSLLEVKIITLN